MASPSLEASVAELVSPERNTGLAPELGLKGVRPASKGGQQAATAARKRYSLFSPKHESILHGTEIGEIFPPEQRTEPFFGLPVRGGGGAWWLQALSPSRGDILEICGLFDVHPLTIEDIMTQESREKIELFPSYYFACFRSFTVVEGPDGHEYEPFNMYAIVFRQGTLTFSFEPSSHAARVHTRILGMMDDRAFISSDWICYALIDDIVDSFGPVIRQLELETDAIEDEVFVVRDDDVSSSFLRVVGRARKNCMALLRLLGDKPDVIRGFTKRCNENFQITSQMDISLYLEDVQDHAVTMAANLSHFENILSRAHRNYLSTLSIVGAAQGADINKRLIKVTLFASLLVPMLLVSGLFGMNVTNPLTQYPGNVGTFFSIVGFMVIAGTMIFVIAKRYRWI